MSQHRTHLTKDAPRLAAAGALALVLAAGAARGADCDNDGTDDTLQTFFWQGLIPGVWGLQDNWLSATGGPPTPDSLAVFDAGGGFGVPPFTATLNTSRSILGLNIINGQTTIDLSGHGLAVNGSIDACRELLVGGPGGATLNLIGGGLFSSKATRVADVAGTSAVFRVGNASGGLIYQHLSLAPVIIGDKGDGTLELNAATFQHDGLLALGENDGAFGKLTALASSQIDLSAEALSQVMIGVAGRGLLSMQQGSAFINTNPADMVLGLMPTGDGTLDVFQNSTPDTLPLSNLRVGSLGKGLLSIRLGSVLNTPIALRAVLGEFESGDGEARVISGGSWKIIGPRLEIAPGGSGRLIVGETASVDADNGYLAFVDGVIAGSGTVTGNVRLVGGEIAPNGQFADTGVRQQLHIAGGLNFNVINPFSGLTETGRMTFTLASDDPDQTMSAVVSGMAQVDGTLRVRVVPGLTPAEGVLFPAIEAGAVSGVFDATQSPLLGGLVAQPSYPGDGNVYVSFIDRGVGPSDLEAPVGFTVPGVFTDGKVVDINGDSFPDLVALSDNGPGLPGEVVVAANLGVDGQGQWLGFSPVGVNFSTVGDQPRSLDIGDMNGDGHPDLVVLNAGPAADQIRIRLNNQQGDFSNLDGRSISVNGTPIDFVLGDINGDERLDVITIFERALLRGTGNGAVQTSEDNGNGFDDADGDTGDDPGSVDTMGGVTPTGVVVTSNGSNSSYIYSTSNITSSSNSAGRGVGLPIFLTQIVPTGRDPNNVYTADIDGDGLDDVITSDRLSGTVSVARVAINTPGEIFYDDAVSLKATDAGAFSMPGSVVAADVNGDARRDLVFTALGLDGDSGVWAILNLGIDDQGGMLFSEAQRLPGDPTIGTVPLGLAVADLDQNGAEDIIVFRAQGSGPSITAHLAHGVPPCNAADIASPFGVLDLQDLSAFINAFVAGDAAADLAPPFGLLDLADINTFVGAFIAGCP